MSGLVDALHDSVCGACRHDPGHPGATCGIGAKAVWERVQAVLDSWRASDHDAAACRDFGCKDCVVVACDFDIRQALSGSPDPHHPTPTAPDTAPGRDEEQQHG